MVMDGDGGDGGDADDGSGGGGATQNRLMPKLQREMI